MPVCLFWENITYKVRERGVIFQWKIVQGVMHVPNQGDSLRKFTVDKMDLQRKSSCHTPSKSTNWTLIKFRPIWMLLWQAVQSSQINLCGKRNICCVLWKCTQNIVSWLLFITIAKKQLFLEEKTRLKWWASLFFARNWKRKGKQEGISK